MCIHVFPHLFLVCAHTHSVGFFMSVERRYSGRLFVLCVLAIVVMALVSSRKAETVSVLEICVHTMDFQQGVGGIRTSN